jgi:hypothetical protein
LLGEKEKEKKREREMTRGLFSQSRTHLAGCVALDFCGY